MSTKSTKSPSTSTSTTPIEKTPQLEQKLTKLQSGLKGSLPSTVTTIPVAGEALTPAQIEALIDGYLAKFAAADAAKAAYSGALADRATIEVAAEALDKDVSSFLRILFANNLAALTNFGIAAKARAKETPLETATRVQKAKATRARNKPAQAAPDVQLVDASGNVIGASAPAESTASPAPAAAAPAAAAPSAK